eukprot:351140-Chlamydomonas_euryale.AAC.47
MRMTDGQTCACQHIDPCSLVRGKLGMRRYCRSSRHRRSLSRSRSQDSGRGARSSRQGGSRSRSPSRSLRNHSRNDGPARAPSDAGDDLQRSASQERRARLEAWKARQGLASSAAQGDRAAPPDSVRDEARGSAHAAATSNAPASDGAAWAPWDDPASRATNGSGFHAPPAQGEPAMSAAWLPTSDAMNPAAVAKEAAEAAAAAAAVMAAAAPPEDDDVDPLDAFMANEVMPEVKEKQTEEAKKKEAERMKQAELLAKGKPIPTLEVLEDDDSEEEPDLEITVPTSKIKLVIGPNGTTIGTIQRKSKARVQIKRDEEELNRAWGSGPARPPKLPPHVRQLSWMALHILSFCCLSYARQPCSLQVLLLSAQVRQQMQRQAAAAAKAAKEGRLLQGVPGQQAAKEKETEKADGQESVEGCTGARGAANGAAQPGGPAPKMSVIMVFGDEKAVEIAERMILEAVENKEQKAKQREQQYDKKREEKKRARLLYYMRHTKDYEALGLQPGSSKVDVKKAYRKLAMQWWVAVSWYL